MQWRDTGILLGTRPHGETAVILDVFTPTQGRHSGVLPGGRSRTRAAQLQAGAQLDLQWRARLEDHIGSYTAEVERSRAGHAMSTRLMLAGLNTVTGLLMFCLPERAPFPGLYTRTEQLLDLFGEPELWPLAYLRWEFALLEEMGFALDFSRCAVTGETEGLAFVSPRTGRAVTRAGAGTWKAQLLPLPPVLLGQGSAPDHEISEGYRTTGHFLHHHLAPSLGHRPLPSARDSYVELFIRQRGQSASQARLSP